MSADNTILVVKRGGEFRVAHIQNAEQIIQQHDEQTYIYYFKQSPSFPTIDEALKRARDLEDELEADGFFVEYGTVVFVWPDEKHIRTS